MLITSRRMLSLIDELEASVTETTVRLPDFEMTSQRQFRREFTRLLQENPRSYRRRLRLELAANWLVATHCHAIEVAVSCGFQSREGMARAFTAQFEMPPQEFRQQVRRRLANRFRRWNRAVQGPVTVVHRPAQTFAFVRAYGGMPAILRAWKYLLKWRSTTQAPTRMACDFSYDTLGITPQARHRYDAAMIIPDEFDPGENVGLRRLPAGTFAKVRVRGTPLDLDWAWTWLVFRWLPTSGYRIRSWFGLTVYLHRLPDSSVKKLRMEPRLVTELYIPIEPGDAEKALLVSF